MSLQVLPNEPLVRIGQFLTDDGLVQLSLTNHRCKEIAESLLWSSLEFHSFGYHESPWELQEPPPFISPAHRHARPAWGTAYGQKQKSKMFLKLLQDYHETNPRRLAEICSRVRNLCTIIDLDGRRPNAPLFWHLLPYFTNLETLELHGDGPRQDDDLVEKLNRPLLPHLRFAKIFAYVPREVVRYIMRSSATLERIEIGALDRPISWSDHEAFENKPLPEDKLGVYSDGESDYGSLTAQSLVPRPLGNILPDDVELHLPKLQHLYLCQPAEAINPNGYDYSYSTRAEKSCFADWRRLLEASEQTLETLVLEQRPGAEFIESDEWTQAHYLRNNEDGEVNKELAKLVRELLSDHKRFPRLKQVYLRGFAVGETTEGRPSDRVPGGHLMLDLERRGIKCEARLGGWCYFDSETGYTKWCHWGDSDDVGYSLDEGEEDWNTLLASV